MNKMLLTLAVFVLGAGNVTANASDRLSDRVETKRLVPVPDDQFEPLDVEVWIRGRSRPVLFPGEVVNINFRTNRDGYVLLYDVDTEGRVQCIFSRSRRDPEFVRGGVVYSVPSSGSGYKLVVSGPAGEESIVALASDSPLTSRWDAAWEGTSDRPDFDRLGDTSYRLGTMSNGSGLDRDFLRRNLVEVPVDDRNCRIASDEVSFRVAEGRGHHRRWKNGRG